MEFNPEPEQQRIPTLGSEVRFVDGAHAGKVLSLGDNSFVVARGKKRVRKLSFSYDSILVVGKKVVMLRQTRSDLLYNGGQSNGNEREPVSKRGFIGQIDERLRLNNSERAERIARVTLYLVSKRLSPDQKKQLKKSLPSGIRSLWVSVEQHGNEQYFSMSDFLLPIKKQGRFRTMEEAFVAAQEVISALKKIMSSVEALEVSRSLPRGLKDIWESTS